MGSLIRGVRWRLLIVLMFLGCSHSVAQESPGWVLELRSMVEDAADRAGVSVGFEAGTCPGQVLGWQEAYCVRHDVMATRPDDEVSPAVRRSALVDRLAYRLRGHPLAVPGRDPFAGRSRPWLDHALAFPEGRLTIRLDDERAHFLSAVFTPEDPIRPCLQVNATRPDVYALASSYGATERDDARRVLACSRDLYRSDAYGQTPLFYAVAASDGQAVHDFLLAGADPNHRANGGWTPLMMAARDTDDPRVVTALLGHGADPFATSDDEPRLPALWYARQNDALVGTTALLQMAVTGLQRVSAGAEALRTDVVDEGAAPYLSPVPAPTEVEVVVYSIEMTVEADGVGRVLEGEPPSSEQFAASFELSVSAAELRLPFERFGMPHVAVISYVQDVDSYVQDVELSSQGEVAEFESLMATIEDEVFIEIREAHAGILGDTVLAVGGEPGSADDLQILGLVPFGDFAVGRIASPREGTRIGTGARLASAASFQVDGINVTVEDSSVVRDAGPREVRTTHASTSSIGPIADADWLFEYVTSMESTSSFDATYRRDRQLGHVTLEGEERLVMTTTMTDGDFVAETEVVVHASMHASGDRIEWLALPDGNRRGVLSRVTQIVLDRIP